MDNLTPITRKEILMNDEPLTPITREEKILAGEDLTPVTRREYFLKKYRHAGGDVMVEGLSVTENGTYTAPEGKAYSPVEVAVPMPENAYLLKEASGSLVSFNDGADLPMPSFVCNIDAQQDLHGYDAPWVGGAGKNKLELNYSTTTVNGVTGTLNDDGSIEFNGTATGDDAIFVLAFGSLLTPLLDKSLIINGNPLTSGSRLQWWNYDGNNTSAVDRGRGSDAFTPTSQNGNVAIVINENTECNHLIFKPMIRLASETDPTFAPYSNICPISGHTGVEAVISPTTETSAGTTYSVSWQTEAGEVYGGYVDLVSGVLTVTDGYIDLGTCEWLRTDLDNNNYRYYTTEVSNLVKAPSSTSDMPNIECSHYKNKLPSQYNQAVDGITIYTNGSIQVYDSTKSALTTTDFKTAMDGIQLVYELATPITYQLTPTQIKSLLGNNNAWCDTGDVDIDYFAKEV